MNNFFNPIKKVSASDNENENENKMLQENDRNLPAESNTEKQTPPLDFSQDQDQKEIFTSRKHLMDYFTTDGVILRTGLKNKRDWYLLPLRETLDNNIDFLWSNYKGSDRASIAVDVKMDDKIFYLKIRNSNNKNIPVFPNLKAIFDYEIRYGSKQDVHIITRGMLGDALKQILSLGYVLLHAGDDGTSFEDAYKQWEHPLIIRHNKKEWLIYLNFDKAEQNPTIKVKPNNNNQVTNTDTEIELKLPVIDEVRNSLTRDYVEEFCRKYTLFTTDISFKFSILDDITHDIPAPVVVEEQDEEQGDEEDQEDEDEYTDDEYTETDTDADIGSQLVKVLSKVPPKGILSIDIPALHPISTDKDWSNANTIHSYTPEEFMRRLTDVHDKKNTIVYDMLLTFREGTQIAKTPENQISISQLVSSKTRHKKMKRLYNQLKNALDVPRELSLPYTTNAKKRMEILYSRIVQSQFYDIDTEKEAVYKIVRGFYNDGTVQYPYAFEIIAIPRTPALVKHNPIAISNRTIFIGAVNYSVSPKTNSNNFEGEYPSSYAKNMPELLQEYGFRKLAGYRVKIPCLIIGNLITPQEGSAFTRQIKYRHTAIC